MKFDKTCCTTCDAKANAEYVAKLEKFVLDSQEHYLHCHKYGGLVEAILEFQEANRESIKHAQQNNSTNGAS